jgi:hypothetical protein
MRKKAVVRELKQKREIIPPWNMPSDPVKAVFWFVHWSLKVLVRFFWIPIIAMAAWETYLNWKAGGIGNGLIGGFITLLVGVAVWGALALILLFLNVSTRVSQFVADVNRIQQDAPYRSPFSPLSDQEREDNVVEGTITDLEEERQKRRRE